ncbi:uncharacterized protein LOC133201853 [Saccostrea echinata]|uniref:uncharacterized protein LOC133201853 n=1 Tax=Saccostrea echinata TaxID=191078 RepID=UPI002A83E96D|nr:uncharacterized protein LOC133201853 [Saccostrea echinata]
MNFLDVKDARFHDFRKTLDARMKELASQGIGVSIKQADPLTPEQEDVLWEKKLLGSHTSKSYINTVFYYNCKLFGLRGPDEHRKLEVCQIKCGDSDGNIEFCGRTSKNFSGGLHQRNILAKTIRHYSESGTLRAVCLMFIHISLVGEGSFYRRPLPGPEPRFGIHPIGVNKLGTIIKTMCAEAGFVGNFSNHSGKRTCSTTLFQSGFEEQQIMERTGHRSSAVKTYKRQSEQQLLEVSRALEPPQKSLKQCDDVEKENAIIPKPEDDGKENSTILPKHPEQDVRIPMGDKAIRFENCSVSMSFFVNSDFKHLCGEGESHYSKTGGCRGGKFQYST